jgi:hypothetical protein
MAIKQTEAVLEEEIDQIADEIVEEIENELKLSEASSSKKKKAAAEDSADEEEEMEEGELPPALKKAIDAKKKKSGDSDDDDEDEEKDEEKKKSVKEAAVAAPELPKTKHEMMRNIFTQMQGTNKKQLSDAYARLMGSLLGEEEDEEEEEQASSKGKKVSEKRKIITKEDIDVADDLNALFGDNDLSEEFKTQTQTIFEAAVVAKINTELELLESNYAEMLENAKEEILSEITDKVDSYLSYVVEEWVKDNELSVERGLKTEITEEFIGGLKSLFEEHYIDVPEEKVDVVDGLADRIETLESDLNENIDKNVELSAQVTVFQKTEILRGLSEDLTDIEFEKLKGLSEGVEFENCDQYESALKTIKENYFPKNVQRRTSDEEDEISTDGVETSVSPQMAAYMSSITRTVDKPIVETS